LAQVFWCHWVRTYHSYEQIMKFLLALGQLALLRAKSFNAPACRQENGGVEGIYVLQQRGLDPMRVLDAHESPTSIPCSYDAYTQPMQETQKLGIWTQEWIVRETPDHLGFHTISQISTGRFLENFVATQGSNSCKSGKLSVVTRMVRYHADAQHWIIHEIDTDTSDPGNHYPIVTIKNNATKEYLWANANENGDFLSAVQKTPVEWIMKCRRSLEVLSGTYVITQKETKQVLAAKETPKADWGVVTEVLDYTRTQHWILRNMQGSVYTVSQESTGRFLDAYTDKYPDPKYNFSLVTRIEELDQSQDWYLQPRDFHEFRLQHMLSGRYVDAGGRIGTTAFTVDQKTPTPPDLSQRWIMRKVASAPIIHGYYRLQQKSSGRFLDTIGPREGKCEPWDVETDPKPGCSVVTREKEDPNQIWRIVSENGEIYTIRHNATGMCLDSFDHPSLVKSFNFTVVLRPEQPDQTQKWFISWKAGEDPREYKIEKHMNNRYLDSFEKRGNDYMAITSEKQPNESQVWIFVKTAEDCVPLACPDTAHCGVQDDGCGSTLHCGENMGTCVSKNNVTQVHHSCVNFACECTPKVECAMRKCGVEDDGCGGEAVCGAAQNCLSANADGVTDTCNEDGTCTCLAKTECEPEFLCGEIDDLCGGVIPCGTNCTTFAQNKHGNDTAYNVTQFACKEHLCECTPKEKCAEKSEEIEEPDGCGGVVQCCTPRECTEKDCGEVDNGCKEMMECPCVTTPAPANATANVTTPAPANATANATASAPANATANATSPAPTTTTTTTTTPTNIEKNRAGMEQAVEAVKKFVTDESMRRPAGLLQNKNRFNSVPCVICRREENSGSKENYSHTAPLNESSIKQAASYFAHHVVKAVLLAEEKSGIAHKNDKEDNYVLEHHGLFLSPYAQGRAEILAQKILLSHHRRATAAGTTVHSSEATIRRHEEYTPSFLQTL